MRILFTAGLIGLGLTATTTEAATLDRIKESRTITLGYRTDAIPFSYQSPIGEAAGYSVTLCKAVAANIKAELGLDKLEVRYLPIKDEGSFTELLAGQVDLVCGATTQTLARREVVDFSLPTFVTGSTLLYRKDGPNSFEELAGQKIGVRAGTTTEAGLKEALAEQQFQAELVPLDSHEQGVADLAAGRLAAYFGDGAILLYLWAKSPDADRLMVSDHLFSNEPYALPLPKGDSDFRLAVDRALAGLYRSGIDQVFTASFGPSAEPSPLVQALYLINALPD